MFFFFDVTRKEQQMSWFCFPLLTHAANAAAVLGLLTGRRRVFLSLNCLCRFLFCIPVYSVVKHPDQAVNQVEFFLFWLWLSANVFGLFSLRHANWHAYNCRHR